jgi:hypothetical protein
MRHPLITLTTLVVGILILTACGQEPRWQAANPSDGTAAGGDTQDTQEEKIVLFAKADPGPLAVEDPDLATRFPRDMTKYIHSLTDFVEARYSEVLPSSSSTEWSKPVGALSGANVGVTCRIESIEEKRVVGEDKIQALVTMEAYNVRGEKFWEKTASGRVPKTSSPKLATPGAQPNSRAAWEAARRCAYSLSKYLGSLSAKDRRWTHDSKDMGELPLIDIAFDSIPPNADILIDGIFRGTTPAVVPVPDKEVEVQIRRQGYQTWSTTLRPEVGMPIKPALEVVPNL